MKKLGSVLYYGTELFYRVKERRDGRRIAISIRSETEKILAEKTLRVPRELSGLPGEEVVKALAPKFFNLVFGPGNPVLSGETWIPRLPLAAVWAADRDAMTKRFSWKKSTADEYACAMEWLIERFGERSLEQLLPQNIALDLQTGSIRKTQSRVRAITAIFDFAAIAGVINNNPWENYKYRQWTGLSASRNITRKRVWYSDRKVWGIITLSPVSVFGNTLFPCGPERAL